MPDDPRRPPLRQLVIVLGDQLDAGAAAFDGFDDRCDRVWMAEVAEESTHVWSTKPRIAIFLAAMRHFAAALRAAGRPLDYLALDAPGNPGTLAAALRMAIDRERPQALVMTAPGDWRVLQALRGVAASGSSCATTGTSSPPCASSAPMRRAGARCAWRTGTGCSAAGTAC